MMRSFRIATPLIAMLLASAVAAQKEEAPERRLDLREVRELRDQTEANAALDDRLRARIVELYDTAISALESAAAFDAEKRSSEREAAGVDRLVEALRAELRKPERLPRVGFSEDAGVGVAENQLARERARLAANRSALRNLERLSEERASTRTETSRRLGALDQEIETLNDEIRAVSQQEAHPEQKNASRTSLLARREAAQREIDAQRARLALLDARGKLLPWRIDQAQRRVAYSEELVELIENAAHDLRLRDARDSLLRVQQQCRDAGERSEALVEIAAETERLAEDLWGPDGVISRSDRVGSQLSAIRKYQSDLDRIVQLTRRKFEAYGLRGSLKRWWPETPEDFPTPGEVAGGILRLEREIPEVQHELIRLEQQRSATRALEIDTLDALDAEHGEGEDQELRVVARDLLDTRRELLDDLIQKLGRYSNRLIELEEAARRFVGEEEGVRSFLYARLLWVRSVPRPVIPRAGDIAGGFRWLASGSNLKETIAAALATLRAMPFRGLGYVLVIGVLLFLRPGMRRRLAGLAEQIASPEARSYRPTLEAFVYTIVLAAPLPFVLSVTSQLLARPDASTYVYSASEALYHLAFIAALLEITRQLMIPDGLAEAHFDWPKKITRRIHRRLLWREIVFLPLIYVAIQMGEAGMRLDSPDELQAYNNAFGRMIFIFATTILGVSLLALFRPRKRGVLFDESDRSWLSVHRLYMYAYPVIALGTVVPAILAALGFYITGYLLAYQMLRTVGLMMAVLILGGMLFRWQAVSRAAGADELDTAEAEEAAAQVRQLFRFVLALAAVIGLFSIWSEAVPGLEIMKRIQIWPRIALMDEGPDGLVPTAAAESTTAAEAEPTTSPAVPGVPLPTGGSGEVPAPEKESSPLTLWHLLQSLLTVAITLMLARNVPGLLELALRRRKTIDSGARIAVATLIRYTIMIIGVSIAFGQLGISWSKIQWLAAALTFGLGFGLQEIVANFVSGLILLTERPVRVGDAVTVGNLQGRVSRIQIRATTITLWDQSEMIVPNKEFITTKLVNWTLSDSRRRIEIPLRVAYNADLEKVKEILVQVAKEHPDVLKDPEPHALLLEFGDDAMKFELRYFVDFGMGLRTRDELHMRIDRAFREAGIEFALPRLNIEIPRRRPT